MNRGAKNYLRTHIKQPRPGSKRRLVYDYLLSNRGKWTNVTYKDFCLDDSTQFYNIIAIMRTEYNLDIRIKGTTEKGIMLV